MVQGKDESGGWKEGRKASPAAAATTTTYYYSRWSLLFVFDGNLSVCIKVAQSMYVTPHRHRHHNHHHPDVGGNPQEGAADEFRESGSSAARRMYVCMALPRMGTRDR